MAISGLSTPTDVRSSAEDQAFYCPIPEDARETRFLCTINAPNLSRLKALVDLWDLGRHTTLRDELIKGRDFIVMLTEWWPDIPCPRWHGWWVQAVDSVILTRCKRCQVWCSSPSWTLPPRRATPVVPERNPGTRSWLLNPEPPLDPVLTDPRGATLGQFHPGRKRDRIVPCVR
jgi:hypothetical protein